MKGILYFRIASFFYNFAGRLAIVAGFFYRKASEEYKKKGYIDFPAKPKDVQVH